MESKRKKLYDKLYDKTKLCDKKKKANYVTPTFK